MKTTPILTIAISSLALILTLLNMYFQYFRKISRLSLRFFSIKYSKDDSNKLTFFIGNSGNVQYLLDQISILETDGYPEGYGVVESNCPTLPLVLELNKVNTIDISFSTAGYEIDKYHAPKPWESHCTIHFCFSCG